MKAKGLSFIGCLAATALISSPLLAEQQRKSVGTSHSRTHRTAPRTTQATAGSQRTINSPGNRHYAGTQRNVSTRQYSGSRYYTRNRYAGRGYYGGPRYYYGGSSYPYSYYGGYANSYSYYRPGYTYYQRGYGYDDATVAAVQRRLGEMGYNVGMVDGVVGPQTRAAIAAFQSTHGMVVDGVITTRLLNRMGLT